MASWFPFLNIKKIANIFCLSEWYSKSEKIQVLSGLTVGYNNNKILFCKCKGQGFTKLKVKYNNKVKVKAKAIVKVQYRVKLKVQGKVQG